MPAQGRRGTRGPGGDTPRQRAAVRREERAARTRSDRGPATGATRATAADVPASPQASRVSLGLGFTRRALAIAIVLVILFISYAQNLRLYFRQSSDMKDTREQIATRTTHIAELQDEVDRWNDPAYVKAQARDRLGWVVPGETGYVVVDENGAVVGESTRIETQGTLPDGEHAETWWERMWGSVVEADTTQTDQPG